MTNMVSCPICYENFKTTDDVYSTSCGHVYHFACMQQWKSRSSICPQCRSYNPTSQKIFFSFDATDSETNKKLEDLKKNFAETEQNLKQMEKNNSEMQLELDEKERMLTVLKNQMEPMVTKISLLESNLEASEEKIIKLDSQFDACVLNRSQLEQELDLFKKEVGQMAGGAAGFEDILALKVQVNMMERTLKEKDEKIQFLYLEKYKLEEALKLVETKNLGIGIEKREERRNLVEGSINKPKKEVNNNPKIPKKKKKETSNQDAMLTGLLDALNLHKEEKSENEKTDEEKSNLAIGNIKNSVVIKGLASTIEPNKFKLVVVKLAALMGLSLTESDINNVKMLESKRNVPGSKITLCAEFKETSQKIKFLASKSKLRTHPETMGLFIYEYNDEKTLSLFHFASVLRTFGYKVCCRQNMIFASKNNRETKIYCSQQVHALLRSEKENTNHSSINMGNLFHTNSTRSSQSNLSDPFFNFLNL